jgi:hypothetical protein
MRGYKPIFTHGKGELGIDDDGHLYWNRQPVITGREIRLRSWELIIALVAACSTLAIAVVTVLNYLSK